MRSHAQAFDLTGKTALVTGAARGLGSSIALALAGAGADVALGLKNPEDATPLADQITAIGRKTLRLAMDVTQLEQIHAATARLVDQWGHLDILINNAGIGPPAAAEKVTLNDFEATLNVNLKGTFFASQAAGRIMIQQQSGCIINLSSQAGVIALQNESVYCMTKAAIAHLTKCLALEWAPHHIRVNAVAPTFIRTPGTEKWLADESFKKDLLRRIPLNRIGEPEDVAHAIVFLASPAASLITGETLVIDGGWTLS